jgi:hypothetical protein
MTRDASFKKVVRRHAEETGQRYTEALTDLEGLGARMHHEPVPGRLLAHLRDRYGVDPVAATKISVHKTYVFRIDRNDGSPWVAPDHAVLSEQGPVAINWKASGRGPRLADLAYLIWGTGSWNPRRPNQEWIDAAVNAYRPHVEPTDDELDRLEAVMYIRPLYLACFGYRRALTSGSTFNEWGFIEPPEYFSSTATAVRTAFRR